jgi:hypothetical protein
MATAIDPTPFIDAAKCSWCKIPPGMIWYAVLAALIDVGNGDTVSTDPNVIMDEARCLECAIPAGYLPYAILAAISNITGGGGGGTGGVTCGVADPVAAPANACTLFYRTDTGTLWMWNGSAWVNLIA